MGEAERGEGAPRICVSFWCANNHQTRPSFSADAAIPETWECPRCGSPAGRDEQNPPARLRAEPYRTHLAYVKERRTAADGEAILAEALARLRGPAPAGPPVPDPQAGGPRRRRAPARACREPAGQADPAPPGPAAEEWCGDCGYQVTAPGHLRICLGHW